MAAGALALYLLTLNHWVSLSSLTQAGRIAGWTWQPELQSPVYYVATYPLRWLPAQWVPLGLNLFSGLCAALVLAQLARSVALLPHDRTHEQREREKSDYSLLTIGVAWFPPVVAALVCGLQLTFWENATNGTGEMLDLLIFAWVIRALLEYRIDGRDKWLFGAALVYGVGMTNNYAMWGFLPAFVAAIIWVRGMSFFNARFLTRAILLGLAGLSLYLLLPLLSSLSDNPAANFWQALKINLGAQKYVLLAYPKVPTRDLDNVEWVILVVVCVLPVLLYSIRWPSYFGDTSQLGIRMATIVFHFMFALYLCVCIWCLFDAPFSPRHKGLGLPFLTFYYLAALSVGYFTGYFLLVFSNLPVRGRLPSPSMRTLNRIVVALVVALTVIAPAALAVRNLPQIRTTNGSILRDYAAALAEGLPQSGILLSDDSRKLLLTQAWLARTGRLNDFILLDTQALSWSTYHRFLQRLYPTKWKPFLDAKSSGALDPVSLVQILTELAKSAELYYLHPSFGYYFEYFHLEPHKLVYQLKRFGNDSLLAPPLAPELIAANESFWTKVADQYLKPVLAVTAPRKPGTPFTFAEQAFKSTHVPREANAQALTVGAFYSRALNEWGAEVQKVGDLDKAAAHFELASQLNPENIVAQINLEYNRNLRAGQHAALKLPQSVEDRFGKYRTWDEVLSENGPYDEPGFCYAQGDLFLRSGHYRQAAQAFERVRAFSPNDLSSRMRLAQLNLLARLPDNALQIVEEVRGHPGQFTLTRTNQNDLLGIEARAYFVKSRPEQAVNLFAQAVEREPQDQHLLMTATGVYFENGSFTNALLTLDRLLKIAPDSPFALVNRGVVSMQLNAFDDAIKHFTRAWTVQTNNYTALLYRAACQIRANHLDAAQQDYETLRRALPTLYQVHYGLGEISYRRKDTNAAIRHYENYVAYAVPSATNAAPNAEEVNQVASRLAELKGGKR